MNDGFLGISTGWDSFGVIGRGGYTCFDNRAAILNKVQEWYHDDTDAAMISQPSDCHGLNGEPTNDEGNGNDASRRSEIG